jgi:hypothetical protein
VPQLERELSADDFELSDRQRADLMAFIVRVDATIGDGTFRPGLQDYEDSSGSVTAFTASRIVADA